MASVCRVDSDGVAFVNDFLKKIEDDGTWTELWQILHRRPYGRHQCSRAARDRRLGNAPSNGRNETIRKRMMRFIALNCFRYH